MEYAALVADIREKVTNESAASREAADVAFRQEAAARWAASAAAEADRAAKAKAEARRAAAANKIAAPLDAPLENAKRNESLWTEVHVDAARLWAADAADPDFKTVRAMAGAVLEGTKNACAAIEAAREAARVGKEDALDEAKHQCDGALQLWTETGDFIAQALHSESESTRKMIDKALSSTQAQPTRAQLARMSDLALAWAYLCTCICWWSGPLIESAELTAATSAFVRVVRRQYQPHGLSPSEPGPLVLALHTRSALRAAARVSTRIDAEPSEAITALRACVTSAKWSNTAAAFSLSTTAVGDDATKLKTLGPLLARRAEIIKTAAPIMAPYLRLTAEQLRVTLHETCAMLDTERPPTHILKHSSPHITALFTADVDPRDGADPGRR